MEKRLLSGVKPTNRPHLGNYFGAMRQFVDLQDKYKTFIMIADYHALNIIKEKDQMSQNILDIALDYLAIGLDPKKVIIFKQSDVSAHAELTWIFDTLVPMPFLMRAHAYKDALAKDKEISVGTFNYPVLMAADILLYDTDTVPVGNDQKQHIEITRDIAVRVNNKFPGTFVVPEGRFLKEGARIMSLDDPLTKMSKSSPNPFSRISLLDDEDTIRKAVKKATTDSFDNIAYDEKNRPAVSNLLTIYSVFSGMTIEKIVKLNEGKGYGAFKKDLGEVIITALRPIKERYEEIRNSEELVVCLRDGSERAYALAEKTMKRVKDNFGLGTVS